MIGRRYSHKVDTLADWFHAVIVNKGRLRSDFIIRCLARPDKSQPAQSQPASSDLCELRGEVPGRLSPSFIVRGNLRIAAYTLVRAAFTIV